MEEGCTVIIQIQLFGLGTKHGLGTFTSVSPFYP